MDFLKMTGVFSYELYRGKELIIADKLNNGITNQGKNSNLNVYFHNATQIATWYMGLINNSGFTSLDAADTHESHAGWAELTDYDEATRVEWQENEAASQSITNTTQAVFTLNATVAIRGMFLASVNTKASTGAGTLWTTAAFASGAVNADNGDVLKLIYTLNV
jgi:hypothetical protein